MPQTAQLAGAVNGDVLPAADFEWEVVSGGASVSVSAGGLVTALGLTPPGTPAVVRRTHLGALALGHPAPSADTLVTVVEEP
jgi:hypothetical protein